jgi:hypothetical protein
LPTPLSFTFIFSLSHLPALTSFTSEVTDDIIALTTALDSDCSNDGFLTVCCRLSFGSLGVSRSPDIACLVDLCFFGLDAKILVVVKVWLSETVGGGVAEGGMS